MARSTSYFALTRSTTSVGRSGSSKKPPNLFELLLVEILAVDQQCVAVTNFLQGHLQRLELEVGVGQSTVGVVYNLGVRLFDLVDSLCIVGLGKQRVGLLQLQLIRGFSRQSLFAREIVGGGVVEQFDVVDRGSQ